MKTWLALLLLVIALGGCMPRSAEPPDMHTSRNALDWAGSYEGVLPCADCPGIKTRLVLHADGRFSLERQYLERQVAAQMANGRFLWNTAGDTIVLDAAGSGQQFRVGEGRLLQLDRDGTAPPWNTPNRVLTLQPRK
jgi:uncharacterized lipoprotein NlpE involved in copper resistance